MAEDRDYELKKVLETYRRDGSMIREKARVLTEEGLDNLYARLTADELPTSVFLDLMKFLAEIGDLKPKQSNTPVNPGAGFSITINIPQTDGKPPITLEATSTAVPDDEDVMGVMSLGEVPIHQLGRLGGLDKDLIGDSGGA